MSILTVRLLVCASCGALFASYTQIVLLWKLVRTIEAEYQPGMSPLLEIHKHAMTPILAGVAVIVVAALGIFVIIKPQACSSRRIAGVVIAIVLTTTVLAILTAAGIVGLQVLFGPCGLHA